MFRQVVVSILFLSVLVKSEGGVMTLNDTDFPDILEEHPHLFIKLYTPWCGPDKWFL